MALLEAEVHAPERVATRRRYLMCRPEHFDVTYAINPWMHPGNPVDRPRAVAQWDELVSTYRSLGHSVELAAPVPGLPDMVFAANSAITIDGRALLARFRHPQRRGEEPAYRAWFEAHGFGALRESVFVNEGEGDFAPAGQVVLAGWGFRTDRRAHVEAAAVFGRDVVSLRLVDPRFYHLDTALSVLGERDGRADVMYFPEAFSLASRRRLRELFPDALLAGERDALAFGLNATSDGRHVVLSAGATTLARQLRARGYEPMPIDVSELLKAGGGVKCCTLELRGPQPRRPEPRRTEA